MTEKVNENRHVHADFIIEAANDISIKWQRFDGREWFTLGAHPMCEYRKKPRELKDGHWYACSFEGRSFVAMYNGECLMEPVNAGRNVSRIDWTVTGGVEVGESLGEIKFPSQ